jgi:hypothetical protein
VPVWLFLQVPPRLKKEQNEISNDEWWVVVCCCGDQSNRETDQDKRENEIEQKTDINKIETINGSVFTSAKQKSG